MDINFRTFNYEADFDDLIRIWQEVGWIEQETLHEQALMDFVQGGESLVSELDGQVEGFANFNPGKIKYINYELPLQAITAITVGHVARKQGIAKELVTKTLRQGRKQGFAVSALGIFDQGYYDKFGFGTGSYEHFINFDPAKLKINKKARKPVRLKHSDWEEIHTNRLERLTHHGYSTLLSPESTKSQLKWTKYGFGLGYRNDVGKLTHHMWISADSKAHGPYMVCWLAYRTHDELLELLDLLKSLSDQINLVSVLEPADIQLQDLLATPLKDKRITKRGDYSVHNDATAFWQIRILDLTQCIEAVSLPISNNVQFNLDLSDPGEDLLSGRYIVTLGQNSTVREGNQKELPTLTASVNAFTRLWLGVRPASGLCATDDLTGPKHLLNNLDIKLNLPNPSINWLF